jgi:dienelactone hydrolase
VLGLLAAVGAVAQDKVSVEQVHFKVLDASERGAAVVGELHVPVAKGDRLPAVMIVNSTPGFDGRSASYAEALNRAGIATLEVDFMQGRGMPASPRQHMAHAYETLQYLAADPRIDGARVGIMGFSWGGMIALFTSSAELTHKYTGDRLRFAAHLGVYPICWRHEVAAAGKDKHFGPGVYRQVTGRPVHILAGEKDGYDEPDSCDKFLNALPGESRRHFSLTMYPGATFGWDSRFSSETYAAGASRRRAVSSASLPTRRLPSGRANSRSSISRKPWGQFDQTRTRIRMRTSHRRTPVRSPGRCAARDA